MRPGVAIGQREGYAEALTGLWRRLAWALTELESIAADPNELFDEDGVLERLPPLQYALHAASELALGLRPPTGSEAAHAELAAALAGARDATAEVAEVLEQGGAVVAEALLPEWRGALFRIRLARLRAATPSPRRRSRSAARHSLPQARRSASGRFGRWESRFSRAACWSIHHGRNRAVLPAVIAQKS